VLSRCAVALCLYVPLCSVLLRFLI
jgi:hypothetical protein